MKPRHLLSAVSLACSIALLGIAPSPSRAQDDPPAQNPPTVDTTPAYPATQEAPPAYQVPQDAAPGSPTTPDPDYVYPSTQEAPPAYPVPQDAAPGSPTTQDPGYVYPSTQDAAPGSPTSDADTPFWRRSVDRPMNYVLLKGGIYSPSASVDVENIDFGKRAGGAAELAVGRYLLPVVAVELGAGYFQSKNSRAAAPGTMLRVVPLVATGKAFLPLGVFEPYGLFGIGGYISDLDVSGNAGNYKASTEVAFGLHAGAGFNLNLNKTTFVGAEGKYLWSKPSFGGKDIRLDGFITTLDVGFRF